MWSTEGCHLMRKSATWSEGTTAECVCDHLTPFTMLLDLCGSLLSEDDADDEPMYLTLEPAIVTLCSLIVSIICCFFIACHLLWAVWNNVIGFTPRKFTRLNFVVGICLAHMSFLLSHTAMERDDEIGCLLVAIVSHWLMLVVFAWMGIEGYWMILPVFKFWTAIYENTRVPGDTYGGVRWKVWCIAWLLPFSFPFFGILSHIPFEAMKQAFDGHAYAVEERWCWLDHEHTAFVAWTFLGPVTIICVSNIVLYILYLRHTLQNEKELQPSRRDGPKRFKIISLICTSGLLGGTWLLGYFLLFVCDMSDNVKMALGCVYIVLSAAQGVFIVVVHLREMNVRSTAGLAKKRLRIFRRGQNKTRDSIAVRYWRELTTTPAVSGGPGRWAGALVLTDDNTNVSSSINDETSEDTTSEALTISRIVEGISDA
ncbi:adhesion G protein-coupled receptor L1-like [Paramacrobiotus metropolitanus]|uniref:adhesion G protein-coupled receptor L1-like n=1 Tax=Paramacrobiotus metropolitanus TaxID=2943436 RepID=UPI002445B3E0|nr:adhesion G protein-coupled receptor L1-like [Paramacrobiotus metropolitanus]